MSETPAAAAKRREEVFAHLRGLEEKLLDPAVRRSPAAVEALLADDFVEFGTSGGVYGRDEVVDALASERPALRYTASDFVFLDLSWDVVQVRFRTTTKDPDARTETHALRCSLWKMSGGKWRMIFHQGTKTARPSAS